MATRAITFNKMNGFLADVFNSNLHDLDDDVISMRLTSNIIAATDATNTALTEEQLNILLRAMPIKFIPNF